MELPLLIDIDEPCVLVSAAEYNNLTSLAKIARGKVLMEESDYNTMEKKARRLEVIEQSIKDMLNLCKDSELESRREQGSVVDYYLKDFCVSLLNT